ncbi:efflux transporter outer membrane subunit [Methylocystis sp. SB2]|uniref:efflux transporter outer membrane subunit n=1 Tax=Methylocystis sp. (strain SB2) TaxID=743836 RepID=UPI000415014D|nr:efflux transporter outer membrane subunit [Methylocystis sp. SB2]ULO24869.1 efflux transporter outer membrane subunit [Methylocystis sp. SB2]
MTAPALSRSFRPALAAAATLAAALAGCDLEWDKPDLSAPPPAQFREAKPQPQPPIAGGRDFAAKFGSKELTQLVERALDDNQDIAAAIARITQADAQARVSSAALFPTVNMTDIARSTRVPGTTINVGSSSTGINPSTSSTGSQQGFDARTFGFFQLALTASYEVDFWGKNENASKAARILANVSRFDRNVVEISTVAAVLNAYFQVLTAQDRLRIANQNVTIAQGVMDAINARLEAGTATVLDTSQQETILAQQRATIPPLEQTLRQTRNNLAVLLGQTPESMTVKGGSLVKLKFPQIAPGLPSEVLLRRPDVAEAEARLASQEFSVLQARAAFFPSLTLTGLYGFQSSMLSTLIMRPDAIAWQVAGSLTQPVFDGWNLQGQYDLQKGRYSELAALYRKQILTALSDTENALIAIRETDRQMKLLGVAVSAARRALDAVEMRLREGTIDIVQLAQTQTTYFQTEDQLAIARLSHFQAATSLYQALGGGWSPTTREIEITRSNAAYEADRGPWP